MCVEETTVHGVKKIHINVFEGKSAPKKKKKTVIGHSCGHVCKIKSKAWMVQ